MLCLPPLSAVLLYRSQLKRHVVIQRHQLDGPTLKPANFLANWLFAQHCPNVSYFSEAGHCFVRLCDARSLSAFSHLQRLCRFLLVLLGRPPPFAVVRATRHALVVLAGVVQRLRVAAPTGGQPAAHTHVACQPKTCRVARATWSTRSRLSVCLPHPSPL